MPNTENAALLSAPLNVGQFTLSPLNTDNNNQWYRIQKSGQNHDAKNYLASVSVPKEGVQPKAVLIAAHGLNNYPGKFREAIESISEGINLIRIVPAYSGHHNKLLAGSETTIEPSTAPISKNDWLDEHALMYELAEAFCIEYNGEDDQALPIFLLAFSLGATISLADFTNRHEQRDYKGALLLSPAIEITKAAGIGMFLFKHLHYLLNAMMGNRFEHGRAIPSANLEEYRDARATRLSAYAALAELNQEIVSINLKNLTDVGVIVTQGDELVSSRGIKKRINEYSLDWQFTPMKKAPGAKGPKHLYFTEETAGTEPFNDIKRQFRVMVAGEGKATNIANDLVSFTDSILLDQLSTGISELN